MSALEKSALEKFLSFMKVNDNGFEEEEYFDDEYDDYDDFEEDKPRKRILRSAKDDDYDEPSGGQAEAAKPQPERAASARSKVMSEDC